MKQLLSKWMAKWVVPKIYQKASEAEAIQKETLKALIEKAENTQFGKDHQFPEIKTHQDFVQHVPVVDYEKLKPYVERIISGESDVLWPGTPRYFSKTSGTTSGAKYIPISNESMGHHITAARNALLCYIYHTGKADFVSGKMIFLQGSPLLDKSGKIPTGRLSGIVANYVPGYLQKNRMPSFKTNCIEDWETKVDAIIDETLKQDMRLISGIPSWVQMYFERILEKANVTDIQSVFKNFSLLVYGGVNFEPYRNRFEQLIGKPIDSVETFPASEGFFAFQDLPGSNDLLLNIDAGIFYEFVPLEELDKESPKRLTLNEVELEKNYALVISTNAGLWGYNIGDTVKFVSKNPYRIRVTGRVKHFISAFGEHVIASEVEYAIKHASDVAGCVVDEFTLAPQITPQEGLPFHEWFIEFSNPPEDWELFVNELDGALATKNTYYKDLIVGKVLRRAVVHQLKRGSFVEYMREEGKLGGQNKIPRLKNDRSMADYLIRLSEKVVR